MEPPADPAQEGAGESDELARQPKLVHPTWSRKPVWTLRRKVMGNVAPLIFATPFAVIGLFLMWQRGEILGRGLIWFAATPIVGWLALNFLGLYQNRAMHKEMEMRLRADRPRPPYRRYFVGIATPTFRGMLDPHEDVGFLMLHPDKVEFYGEKLRVEIPKTAVTGIRVRPNVHTMVGLGRWVSIEAEMNGAPARLLIEIRQRPTLLGNLRMSRTLVKKLRRWRAEA